MIIQAAAILDRRGDPDRGKTEIADVIETLNQPLEIAAPMRILRLAGLAVELDPVATKEADRRVALVKAGGQQEINGFLAEVLARRRERRRARGAGRGARGGKGDRSIRTLVIPLIV